MYFNAVWVYLLTLPIQLQRKRTISAPYAAHFCTIRNWHDDTPGAAHVAGCCEARLPKLRARCKQHLDKHTWAEAGHLFSTMPPPAGTCNGVPLQKCVCRSAG